MNTKLLSAAVLSCLTGFVAAHAQQVLATDNALTGARIEIDGIASLPAEISNLIDGDFTSVCRIDNVENVSFIFDLDRPWNVSGLNVVAGSDLALATGKITLYAYSEDQAKWNALGRSSNFKPSFPYTGTVSKATTSGGVYKEYSRYKIEITGITGSALELGEIQLLGMAESDKPLSTEANGSFSTPSKAKTPEALNDRNPKTAVEFTGVRNTNGLDDAWIQYSFDEPTAIGAYSLTTNAVSQETMRPSSWELLASDNGSDWVTLDVRCNADNFAVDTYMTTRSLTDQNGGIDFAAISDKLFDLAESDFLYKYGNGKYLIHSWHADASKIDRGYNYWWMAHAIDAYIDAYARTGKSKFQTTANSIKVGMYTAYDAGRQDLWNSYYDDMEWMNLACIRAYENFPRSNVWLSEAKQLFDWIWQGWNYDDGSEGGIRWNSGSGTGKNSCSNAPAMIGAAKLYQLTGEEEYLDKAVMIFDWMLTHSRFDDGFIKDAPGNNDRGWTFTYNQGTWIGGLLELYRITQEQKYYDIAVDLLDKCLFNRWYSPEGILREAGWADGGMFKGILIRYITNWVLSGYLDSERQYRYAQYLIENARSFYNCALQLPNLKVLPDWKHRTDRVGNGENGRPDGYYCSSNLLSGIFLLESADMLRRAGLTDDNYNVVNPAVGKPYRHYRIKFTDTHGSQDLKVAGFSLYEKASHSGVETVAAAESAPVVSVSCGRIEITGTDNALIEVYSTDGILRHSATGTAVETSLPAGIYLVRVTTPAGTTVTKLAL